MNINKKIFHRRQTMKLRDTDVAKLCDLSIDDYCDIEFHADEIYTVTKLSQIKKICKVLEFDFFELFEMPCVFCAKKNAFLARYLLPRNDLIRKQRIEKGMTVSELSDKIGFEEIAIYQMEDNPVFLESWPMDLIEELSNILEVPYQVLLAVQCAFSENHISQS